MKRIRNCLRYSPTTPRTPLPVAARSVGFNVLDPGEIRRREAGDFIEVYWGMAGEGEFSLPNATVVRVGPHEVFSYQPNQTHHFRAGTKGFQYRFWTVDGPLASQTADILGLLPPWPHRVGPVPWELFDRLYELLIDVRLEAERQASCVAYQLLIAASRPLGVETEYGAVDDSLVRECLRILLDEFTDPGLGIEGLARRLKIDRSIMTRRFRRAMGMSPKRYLIGLRMRRALSVLRETGHRINEIAALTGFSSLDYFSRAVHQATGLSPTEYRRP